MDSEVADGLPHFGSRCASTTLHLRGLARILLKWASQRIAYIGGFGQGLCIHDAMCYNAECHTVVAVYSSR